MMGVIGAQKERGRQAKPDGIDTFLYIFIYFQKNLLMYMNPMY